MSTEYKFPEEEEDYDIDIDIDDDRTAPVFQPLTCSIHMRTCVPEMLQYYSMQTC